MFIKSEIHDFVQIQKEPKLNSWHTRLSNYCLSFLVNKNELKSSRFSAFHLIEVRSCSDFLKYICICVCLCVLHSAAVAVDTFLSLFVVYSFIYADVHKNRLLMCKYTHISHTHTHISILDMYNRKHIHGLRKTATKIDFLFT